MRARGCQRNQPKAKTAQLQTAEVKHAIKLTYDQPVSQPCRRVPPAQLHEFREGVKEMLEAGVIRESKSPTLTCRTCSLKE